MKTFYPPFFRLAARRLSVFSPFPRSVRWGLAFLSLLLGPLAAVAQVNLANGLVGCYTFNQGNATDGSGNNNNGTVAGATLVAGGPGRGQAYQFDGVNDEIVLPAAQFLNVNYTYSAWVMPTALPGNPNLGTVISIGGRAGDQTLSLANSYLGVPTSTGWGAGSYSNSTTAQGISTGTLPPLNQWQHLVCTRDNQTLRLYVNGTQVASTPVSGNAFYNAPNRAAIGNRSNDPTISGAAPQYFTGLIDEVGIYNRALTPAEVTALFTGGLPCQGCPKANITVQGPAVTYILGDNTFDITVANTNNTPITGLNVEVLNAPGAPALVVTNTAPALPLTIAAGATRAISVRGRYAALSPPFSQCFRVSSADGCLVDTVCVQTKVVYGCPVSWTSPASNCATDVYSPTNGTVKTLELGMHNGFADVTSMDMCLDYDRAYVVPDLANLFALTGSPAGTTVSAPVITNTPTGTISQLQFTVTFPSRVDFLVSGGDGDPVVANPVGVRFRIAAKPAGTCVLRFNSCQARLNWTKDGKSGTYTPPTDYGRIVFQGTSCGCSAANADFTATPNPVLRGQTVTLTAQDPSGTHFWRIGEDNNELLGSVAATATYAYKTAGTFTIEHLVEKPNGEVGIATRTITVNPVVVHMMSPANGATGVDANTYITATPVAGASTYTFEVSTAPDFTTAPRSLTTPAGGTVRTALFANLAWNTKYYVRVKTNLSVYWGDTKSFTTGLPEAFSFLTEPANGATGVNATLYATARVVANATSYTVELNTSSTFANTPIVTTQSGRSFLFGSLAWNTTYYSRVKTSASPNWGPARSFTTGTPQAYSFVTAPAPGATGVDPAGSLTLGRVAQATTYTVELYDNDALAGAPVFSNTCTPGQAGNICSPGYSGLAFNTVYYSRVKTDLSPVWGPVRTFTTKPDPDAPIGRPALRAANSARAATTSQAYPNPFSGHALVRVAAPAAETVTVTVTDLQGRRLERHQGRTNADLLVGAALAPGVYLLRIASGEHVTVKRLVKQ